MEQEKAPANAPFSSKSFANERSSCFKGALARLILIVKIVKGRCLFGR